MPKQDKSRHFMLLLYPDNPVHVKALDVVENWNNSKRPLQYALILHRSYDMDGEEVKEDAGKPHYHCVVSFDNPCYISALAKTLGLTTDIGEADLQFIKVCHCLDKSLLYLTHTGYDDKEQYTPDDVRGTTALLIRQSKLYYDYLANKTVTVKDALLTFTEFAHTFDRIITPTILVQWLIGNDMIKYRNEKLLYMLMDEHNNNLRMRRIEERSGLYDE